MLRFITVDLLAAYLSVTASLFVPAPSLKPPPSISATAYAKSAQSEVAKKLHISSLKNLGVASWYGAVLNGHKTASGEIFDKDQMTACHRTLPFGTVVRVVDLHTGKSVVVRINDRGVLSPERVIDLSSAAARGLGILERGVAPVRLEVLGRVHRPRTPEAAQTVLASFEKQPLQDFVAKR